MSADESVGETSSAPIASASKLSSADDPAPPAPKADNSNEPDKQSGGGGTDKAAIVGVFVFWAFVFGLIAYWLFKPEDQAQVFLEASPEQPFQVSGLVSFKGAPVGSGTVHVVFDDPEKNQYLGGEILSLAEGGKFATGAAPPEPAGSPPNTPAPVRTPVPAESVSSTPPPIRVTANFSGQQPKGKDKALTAVSGMATLYLNYPPPAGKWAFTVALTVGGVFALLLIILFTGRLTQRRARFLFALAYITTFMSLAVPIGAIVLVSKSQYAVRLMEEAPVGLVKGTAKGVKDPQWLVNLGGAVSPKQTPSEKTTPSPMQTPGGTPSAAAAASTTTPPAQQPTPAPPEKVRPDELQQIPGFALVQGGLAVPFYVIILAMLGAGINMTKRVPDIQKSWNTRGLPEDEEGMLKAALNAPIKALAGKQPRKLTEDEEDKAAWGIRKDLIDTYMGLISAPFLAIAVYYLLQIVATNIAEPVLVIAAFATGFISDSIVTAITKLASDMISKGKTETGKEGDKAEKEKAEKERKEKEKEKETKKEKATQGKPEPKKPPEP